MQPDSHHGNIHTLGKIEGLVGIVSLIEDC